MKTQVIIAAAGSGTRLGCAGPKALVPIGGRPMLAHTLARFEAAGVLAGVVIVASEAHLAELRGCVAEHFPGAGVRFGLR